MTTDDGAVWTNPKRLRYCRVCDLYHGPSDPHYAGCPDWDAETLLLFHQGGSNATIAAWRKALRGGRSR